MSIPATQINFETDLTLRGYLPVTVVCNISGEFKVGSGAWDTEYEEIEDLQVFHNGFELELSTAEELEVKGKIWDEYARIT